MKEGIHPTYQIAEVVCACGNTFQTRSFLPRIRLEVCSACHPFYTGKMKMMDTAGRVERFTKRYAATSGKTVTRKPTPKAMPKVKKVMGKILRNTPKPAPAAKTKAPKAAKPAAKS